METMCECEETGWDEQSAMVNQALMSLPIAIGAWALLRYRPAKLLLYVPGAIAFMTVWRKYICARCQYYGQPCSTMLGVMTARMMPRDETGELDRNAMIADFAFLGALALIPLPQVLKKFSLAVLYLGSIAVGMGSILQNACGRCGNTFCPMKDVREKVLGE